MKLKNITYREAVHSGWEDHYSVMRCLEEAWVNKVNKEYLRMMILNILEPSDIWLSLFVSTLKDETLKDIASNIAKDIYINANLHYVYDLCKTTLEERGYEERIDDDGLFYFVKKDMTDMPF